MANLELDAAFGAVDEAKVQGLRGYYPMAAVALADEVLRLRAVLDAVQGAYTGAVQAANEPTPESAGLDKRQWDGAYRCGVQACASVVWAAMQPHRLVA